MTNTTLEEWLKDEEIRKAYAGEGLLVDILEAVARWMEDYKISYADLAKKLYVSENKVKEIFKGRDISLRELGCIVFAIGADAKVELSPTSIGRDSR